MVIAITNRERFIKTLKCEPIGGQVPTFELVFFLTMEAFGKIHPAQRHYEQWNQMSQAERNLHMNEMAQLYIDTAKRYGHSAIFIHPNPWGLLQTGTKEECRADVLRSLKQGMEQKQGYIFCTSNCAYTGLPLSRYEMMIDIWREYGNYDNWKW